VLAFEVQNALAYCPNRRFLAILANSKPGDSFTTLADAGALVKNVGFPIMHEANGRCRSSGVLAIYIVALQTDQMNQYRFKHKNERKETHKDCKAEE
jgi:hypothetical protein